MIYICIPTHNEQQTVGVVLWKLRQVLTEFHRDYQLLVADDASTDKTTDVLEPYTRVLPLTVIRTDRRQGYAASMEMLLREAVRRSEYPKRDVIVTLQADFSEEPDDVVALIKRMEAGADLAVGIKVGNQKDSRGRRLARALSHFFTRRQSWPEGVVTPFDGYRAYRLYAVKRAIEERVGRRLLHYDGWAGHAELLRAVLPHARRIDTLNVEDRPDRLQRPRREKPFAAAWQVRAMVNGAEPGGLATVEELDAIVASSSRSREAAARAAVAQPRGNGTRDGRSSVPRTGRDRNDRGRTQATGQPRSGPARSRSSRPERARPERASGQGSRPPARSGTAVAGGDPRRRPRKPTDETAIADATAPDVAAPDATAPDAVTAGDATGAEPAGSGAKKRRRRRRGKGAARAGAADAASTEARPESGTAGPADVVAASGPAAVGPEAGATDEGEGVESGEPRKRRRRGGRRGGRGRRRPKADAANGAADGDDSPAEEGSGGGTPAGGGAVDAGGNSESTEQH